jgi:hypothetical protein
LGGTPPPLDLYNDLAVAQAGAKLDTNASDATVARSMRRRIAAMVFTPGMAGALALTAWAHWNIAVGIASFGLAFAILWLYSERGLRKG